MLLARGVTRGLLALLLATVALGGSACSDEPAARLREESVAAILPGELCEPESMAALRLIADPPVLVVAPGRSRRLRLTLEPDACVPVDLSFTSSSGAADAPAAASFDLRHPAHETRVTGLAPGRTTLVAKATRRDDPTAAQAELAVEVEVRDGAPESCVAGEREPTRGTLDARSPRLAGAGGPGGEVLSRAAVAVPPAAFTRTDAIGLPPVPLEIACGGDLVAGLTGARLRPLGPAIRFDGRGAISALAPLRREIELSLPVNPASMPDEARLRHLVVLYQGPRAKAPRAVPVTSPRIEREGDGWVLRFASPWLGTYQAAVEEGAGTHTRRRRLTHRAVIGFSMGASGAATFGLRHHDAFDVLGALGGPSDWTWLLWYIQRYMLGGFCAAGESCPRVAPDAYPIEGPFVHTMDFDHLYAEEGTGVGERFQRREYVRLLGDLALAMGSPVGANATPSLAHLAPGPRPGDPWLGASVPGNAPGADCTFPVAPLTGDPRSAAQADLLARCRAHRCDPANAWRAPSGFFDREYNPEGKLAVISFCDGARSGAGPYANGFAPGGDEPVNVTLAVDRNGNGVRDEGEPVLRNFHEPYDDCGADGICDRDEPGYDPQTNPDPAGDDYDYVLHPRGLEGNHRWDPGEPFRDHGLDGVPGTRALHVAGDPGEGDGLFTESPGLRRFYQRDPHAMIEGRSTELPAGPLGDDALRRIDLLTDGGVRDLFNFVPAANHLAGQLFARSAAGLPLRSVAFYGGFHMLPGQDPTRPSAFAPTDLRWADVADMPSVRFGDVDASPATIDRGDGQHVGSTEQLLQRLQTAVFYVGKRWPGADRRATEESRDAPASTSINELGVDCEIGGRCEKTFTGPGSGRTGPIIVALPPGYAHEANVAANVRYPVLYVLHGYGMEPSDLSALTLFTNNFMNVRERSSATRLPRMILVFVDGRCRAGADGRAECMRGTFYASAARPEGPKLEEWFSEILTYVDRNYRTMPASEVDVTD